MNEMNHCRYSNIAFISYKREDEAWAKWLQKKLEHYKLPADILRDHPDLEFSERPRHVFKDTTDLSGGVLAKAIRNGLHSSKFLVVICSPLAAKSEWVCKEVQDFIDSGREEYIIPFIVEGEPYAKKKEKECFPTALKSLAGERELLGININENGRDSAAVKVVSRLFDLKFDVLWDRFQREARKKRRLVTSAFVFIITFLLAIIVSGVWAYLQINQKNELISMQIKETEKERDRANKERDRATKANVGLLAANDSITRQKAALQKAFDNLSKTKRALSKSNADLAERNNQLKKEKDNVVKANWQMMENLACAVAEKAKIKISEGDVYNAILALLEVLPKDKYGSEMPYVPQAEVALRVAIDSMMGASWKKYALPSGREYRFTYNDKYILSEERRDSSTSVLGVFDVNSLQEKYCVEIPSSYNYLSCSRNDKYLAVGYSSNIRIYDLEKGELVNTLRPGSFLYDSILEEYNPVYLYSLEDGQTCNPNVLTSFFRPENTTADIQVLDYLPQKNWILYRKKMPVGECDEFYVSYTLLDIKLNQILWKISEEYFLPSNYNDVRLSYNGNYIIVSHPGSIDIISMLDNSKRTIMTGEYSEHYSNLGSITKDEKYIFQRCVFTDACVYDVETLSRVDSIPTDQLFPYALSFSTLGTKCIINNSHWTDMTNLSYLYFLTDDFDLNIKDISSRLVRKNINNRIVVKKDGDYALCYNDNQGHKWECVNAEFIGYTPDFQYVAICKNGFRGSMECQLLDVNSGICMYRETPDYLKDEIFEFLLYEDLLKISKEIVKGFKMDKTTRKEYYL